MLAGQFGAAFVDTDAEVAAAAGKPVGDIFVDDGEPAFRELERAAAGAGPRRRRRGGRAGQRRGARPGRAGGCCAGSPWPTWRPASPRSRAASAWTGRGSSSPATRAAGSARMLEERRPVYERLAAFTVPADDSRRRRSPTRSPTWLGNTERMDRGMTVTRIPVGGERPYEVVVGAGVLGELPGLVGEKAGTVFVIHAASVSAHRAPGLPRARGRRLPRAAPSRCRTARRPSRSRSRPGCGPGWPPRASAAPTCIVGDRRGRGDRPGRVRGGDLAARGPGRARPHHAARHGRRRDRRQDRDRHPGGQEPGRRVPRARRGAGRPGHAGDGAARRLRGRAGRDHQGGVRRRPGHPGPGRGRPGGRHRAARAAHPGADRAGHPVQGAAWWRPTSARPACARR